MKVPEYIDLYSGTLLYRIIGIILNEKSVPVNQSSMMKPAQ